MTRVLGIALSLILVAFSPASAQDVTRDAAAELVALIEQMTEAVLARDQAAYLAHVDLSDPVFALEHTRWSDEWAEEDILSSFDMQLDDITRDGDTATATLTMTWRTRDNPRDTREAEYPVSFRHDGETWRYAGEQWVTVETEHFRVRAAPRLERVADSLVPVLPDIYAHVTSSLDHAPSAVSEIKLYATSEALVATTLLSLPPIHGWNEPGEALKQFTDPEYAADAFVLAHEFTHFLVFDMAGTDHSRMPWWMDEGLAQYNAAHFWDAAQRDEYLAISQAWLESGEFAAWETISEFEDTPIDLWQYVYPQGYAFVRYITETFGVETRNAWLRAMSVDMDIEEASEAVLDRTFTQLDADFRAWLAAQ